ncbi:MAG: circularly permuted type 2 ATP-grasp protein [Candidatus Scalindua sp. AMX11]|nr:MAG: circularly permuted type 2 ATP-grasp protein [Candidatus Scalindua sp.]NOG85900.1 circularly permuted type 2 ATP-grasp protein [Planctomycetota bacterium]RZV96929.1 MAG: circularly permuted type 2 ATP-grasp protein [Candidatus Scalindua sp. SCAELEC01]TDE66458.1 MAG: circularly permuted type 2 ATP-grasp protein [Candidatus Scalindua sp. AMX11]
MILKDYSLDNYYDEMIDNQGNVRPWYQLFTDKINSLDPQEIVRRQFAAERAFMYMGVTFNVYQEGAGIEKIFPFDIIPRIVNHDEWDLIEKGLKQRIYALNLFINDVYNDQKIIKDKIIPREIIESSPGFLKECIGIKPPCNIWCHITGTDLIKHSDGQYYVLEDNLRVPSGVSYVLGNREIMKRTFPEVFEILGVRPIFNYLIHLLEMLQYLIKKENPVVAVLTPGIYNSAYFEHSFLAQQMGIQLVEGKDLVVKRGYVYMRTTKGFVKVDVIYRRIDDAFIDPRRFKKDSVLGVPGIFDVWKKRRVAFANALGTGVADDKVIYSYVPEIIKYYLREDAIIQNVPTYLCWDENQRKHVCENIATMVVKAANQAGGYGMLIGPASEKNEQEEFKRLINANPREYIAQPTMALSRVPTIVGDRLEGRHVDLRPYILYGERIKVMPGGLTRVALNKGSLVVNSSQGGGSKDTWVLRDPKLSHEEEDKE